MPGPGKFDISQVFTYHHRTQAEPQLTRDRRSSKSLLRAPSTARSLSSKAGSEFSNHSTRTHNEPREWLEAWFVDTSTGSWLKISVPTLLQADVPVNHFQKTKFLQQALARLSPSTRTLLGELLNWRNRRDKDLRADNALWGLDSIQAGKRIPSLVRSRSSEDAIVVLLRRSRYKIEPDNLLTQEDSSAASLRDGGVAPLNPNPAGRPPLPEGYAGSDSRTSRQPRRPSGGSDSGSSDEGDGDVIEITKKRITIRNRVKDDQDDDESSHSYTRERERHDRSNDDREEIFIHPRDVDYYNSPTEVDDYDIQPDRFVERKWVRSRSRSHGAKPVSIHHDRQRSVSFDPQQVPPSPPLQAHDHFSAVPRPRAFTRSRSQQPRRPSIYGNDFYSGARGKIDDLYVKVPPPLSRNDAWDQEQRERSLYLEAAGLEAEADLLRERRQRGLGSREYHGNQSGYSPTQTHRVRYHDYSCGPERSSYDDYTDARRPARRESLAESIDDRDLRKELMELKSERQRFEQEQELRQKPVYHRERDFLHGGSTVYRARDEPPEIIIRRGSESVPPRRPGTSPPPPNPGRSEAKSTASGYSRAGRSWDFSKDHSTPSSVYQDHYSDILLIKDREPTTHDGQRAPVVVTIKPPKKDKDTSTDENQLGKPSRRSTFDSIQNLGLNKPEDEEEVINRALSTYTNLNEEPAERDSQSKQEPGARYEDKETNSRRQSSPRLRRSRPRGDLRYDSRGSSSSSGESHGNIDNMSSRQLRPETQLLLEQGIRRTVIETIVREPQPLTRKATVESVKTISTDEDNGQLLPESTTVDGLIRIEESISWGETDIIITRYEVQQSGHQRLPYPRPGKTIVPKSFVDKAALTKLFYDFTENVRHANNAFTRAQELILSRPLPSK